MVFHRSSAVRTVMACEPCVVRSATNRRTSIRPACPATRNSISPRVKSQGKTLAEICAQIKDPARNGGRSLEELVHHIGTDTLVGWAWAAGIWSPARAWHAKACGRARRGLGENRGGMPQLIGMGLAERQRYKVALPHGLDPYARPHPTT
jgi:hypothetical protein